MKKQRINDNWTFRKEGNEAEAVEIDLPHDAMIGEERIPDLENGNATGFFPGGKYIYTKVIHGEEAYAEKTVIVELEGVYMNPSVYLNGEKVGEWVYGYTNFYIDLSGKLKIGRENELKVIADNSMTPNSRWYSGSGIYRPVNLWMGGKQYIEPEGIKVKTISVSPAVIEVSVDAVAESRTEIICSVIKDGAVIAEMMLSEIESSSPEESSAPSNKIKRCATVEIADAKLWDAEEPYLYTIKTVLKQGDKILDMAEDTFGIRTLAWDAKQGFQVNGKTVKLRGGCIHHDHGILGACTYDKAEYRRVRKLKEMGYNAIRYSHNPAGKNFLEICDKLGMYVVDETFDQWKLPQSTYDYARYFDDEWGKDVEALVSKDYNHPCVIMYCIGNEITDTGLPFGATIAKMLSDTFHRLDDTRPTTIAINSMLSVLAAKQAERKALEEEERKEKEAAGITEEKQTEEKAVGSAQVNDIITLLPKIMASITPESLETLIGDCVNSVDIVGYNYGQNLYQGTHELKPDRVILSTETFPCKMDLNWETVENNDYVIGDFMWTAWDYLGEAGVGQPVYGTTEAPFSKAYPCLSAACGSFDLTGYPEAQAYYAAVLWGAYQKPYICVRPVEHSGEAYTLGRWRLTDALNCWTWDGCEGKTAEIEVYSIGDSIELYQDGISLGRKKLKSCRCFFQTVYRAGRLEAVSMDEEGNEIARTELVTANDETVLTILPEEMEIKADGEDLLYVAVHITDKNGILKMMTDKKVTFTVDGAGTLLAVGSGNPETTEKFSDRSHTTWHGRVIAVVKSKREIGDVRITAKAEGMESVSVSIQVR